MKGAGSKRQIFFSRLLIVKFFSIMIFFNADAQIIGKSIPELRQEMMSASAWQSVHFPANDIFYLCFSRRSLPIGTMSRNTEIPNLHQYEHLPIFCKLEVKMEQAVRFPIKIRLGNVEYVDRLEGKRK